MTARPDTMSLLPGFLALVLLSQGCAINTSPTPSRTFPEPSVSATEIIPPTPTATVTKMATATYTPTPTLTTTPKPPTPTSTQVPVEPTATLDFLATISAKIAEPIFSELYEQINPAVVSITTRDKSGETGQGSGFVFDKDGRIITNHHVITRAQSIEVTFSTGVRERAHVVGIESTADLAVIQVERMPEDVNPAILGDSEQLRVGQRVVAIGNPFGLDGTMTSGIVSGLGRTLQADIGSDASSNIPGFSAPDIIQTDAAINPGNSGGPLINLDGEVIGVNKAIYSESGLNSGVGFAIPSNIVKRIVPSLISDGSFEYPYIGISSMGDLTLTEIEALELPHGMGVYVNQVDPKGPAAEAGLQGGTISTGMGSLLAGGDLIVAIDDMPLRGFADLLSYLVNHAQVGQVVQLNILREGEHIRIDVTLAPRPSEQLP